MNRYVALLRGINISGKNKISMTDLKKEFEKAGFCNVCTYLNSGNVVFSAKSDSAEEIRTIIENFIKAAFMLEIPVFVADILYVNDVLKNAPDWWGSSDKAIYDNLIFIIPPATAKDLLDKIGEPSQDIEKISVYKNTVFWSFDLKKYQKANWWKKTALPGIGELITIRTANTVRKIAGK